MHLSQSKTYVNRSGILEFHEKKASSQPKKVANKRGALTVDGYTDFNPDANIAITRGTESQAVRRKSEKKKGGCCK